MENCRTPNLWVKNTWLPESFPFKQSIDLGLPWRSGHATDTWLYIEGLIWVIQNGIDQIGYMVVPPELCIWFTNHGNYMITGNFRYHFLIGGLEHFFFPYIGNFIIATDFHIFQKGWNHQPVLFIYHKHWLLMVIGVMFTSVKVSTVAGGSRFTQDPWCGSSTRRATLLAPKIRGVPIHRYAHWF